jgi:hypothetical protein
MSEPSIANLRKASSAVYLACEESVAADISNLLKWAASEIERLSLQSPGRPVPKHGSGP